MNVLSSSPADAGALLQNIQARAGEAAATPVVHQHTTTRGLLRRWTRPMPRNAKALRRLNLLDDPVSSEENGPKGSGAVDDFVPFGSQSMEDFWGDMENDFPKVFTAIDNKSLFTRLDLLSMLRNLVAVHYVRTMKVRQNHFKSFDTALAAAKDWWRQPPQVRLLINLYRAHTCDTRPDQEAIERALDLLFKDTLDLVVTGALLRQRMEDLFQKVRTILDGFNIEIWTPENGAGEFLIGDAPAATIDPHSGNVGLAAGVGLLGFDVSVYMPLGPEAMAWVHRGPGDGFHEIKRNVVDKANAVQILTAEAHAFARPGTSFEAFTDRVRKAQCFPPATGAAA